MVSKNVYLEGENCDICNYKADTYQRFYLIHQGAGKKAQLVQRRFQNHPGIKFGNRCKTGQYPQDNNHMHNHWVKSAFVQILKLKEL